MLDPDAAARWIHYRKKSDATLRYRIASWFWSIFPSVKGRWRG